MEKDATVTIRINSGLRKFLSTFAEEDGKSLSALIETTLARYAEERKSRPREEKRRHPRRPVTIPAIVLLPGSREFFSGMILDVSYGGLKISLPKGAQVETQEDGSVHLDVHFPLPGERLPVGVRCRTERVENADETTDVGASFSDCKFDEYLRLTNYLSNGKE